MKLNQCEQLAGSIVDYVDGELHGAQAQEVRNHLETCPECRRLVSDLQHTMDLANVIWEDAASDLSKVRPARTRKVTLTRGVLIAAGVMIVVTGSILGRWLVVSPRVPVQVSAAHQTVSDVEASVTQDDQAARLLAAGDLMAANPATRDLAESQFRYIVMNYPKTPAADEARRRMQNKSSSLRSES